MIDLFKVQHKGGFSNFEKFCNRVMQRDYLNIFSEYAERGVEALKAATPVETGKTADSWGYEIESGYGKTTIYFTNSSENDGVNIVILLLYGHETPTGAFISIALWTDRKPILSPRMKRRPFVSSIAIR